MDNAIPAGYWRDGEGRLSDAERGQLNAVLNKAFARQTFDPMHSAWESLNDVLKRGR